MSGGEISEGKDALATFGERVGKGLGSCVQQGGSVTVGE